MRHSFRSVLVRASLATSALALMAPVARAQSSLWRVTMASGYMLNNVKLVSVTLDSLFIRDGDITRGLGLGQVTELRSGRADTEKRRDADVETRRSVNATRIGRDTVPPTDVDQPVTVYQFNPWNVAEKKRIITALIAGETP